MVFDMICFDLYIYVCVTCENIHYIYIYIYTFFIFLSKTYIVEKTYIVDWSGCFHIYFSMFWLNQFPLNISVCKSTGGMESSGDSAAAELASDLAACLGAGGGATGPRCHRRRPGNGCNIHEDHRTTHRKVMEDVGKVHIYLVFFMYFNSLLLKLADL